jgi:hypothetical protein
MIHNIISFNRSNFDGNNKILVSRTKHLLNILLLYDYFFLFIMLENASYLILCLIRVQL